MAKNAVPDDLQALVRKRRWSEQDATHVLAAIAPGETQEEFGTRLGVDRSRLSRWKVRLERAAPSSLRRSRAPTGSLASNAPTTTFAHVGSLALGRQAPLAVVELLRDEVRVELHTLEHGEALLAAVFRAIAASRRR